jgi:hypothetical protein
VLEKRNDVPAGIDAIRAVGKVSRADYEHVLEPLLAAARREGRQVRFLYELGPGFEGFSAGAAWEDAKIGLQAGFGPDGVFAACAVVTDLSWIEEATRFARFLLPCPVRVFPVGERAAAIDWLRSLPEAAAVTYRLLPSAGLLVVAITEPLRAQDFDAIALAADTWIERHGTLHGVVLHTRTFPGWENLAALVRHLRFVRDHHRLVERIALVADGDLVALAPALAEHFVQAEVRSFAYDRLDAAIAWASDRGGDRLTR